MIDTKQKKEAKQNFDRYLQDGLIKKEKNETARAIYLKNAELSLALAEESKEVYRLRKSTFEPMIDNIKQNLKFRKFLLRGLDKVKIEMNLECIAHNLQKIWRLGGASGC